MPKSKFASKRIKILFIDHTPFVGGAQICLAKDLEYIDRKKFQPILMIDKACKHESIFKKSRVKILRINFGHLKKIHPAAISEFLTSVKQLLDIIDQEKPDLVVTNTIKALFLAGLVKDYKFSQGLLKRDKQNHHNFKLVARIWDWEYPNWLINTLRVSVDKFLLVSKSVEGFYKLKKPKSEVVYLGSGIHNKLKVKQILPLLRKGKSAKLKVERLKKEMGIEKGDFVVGFTGRLVEWKGPLFLFNSFRKINDPRLKLIFFGTGKGQEDSVEEKLKKEIKKRKLEKRVLLPGFIEDQTLIYAMMNCFVQASIEKDPFAINMIEAALFRVPIIATHIGGTPEFIKSGKNGLLVKPKDTNQLAQALLRLYKEKRLAKRLAGNAYKDVQKFKEERFIKNLERIYEVTSAVKVKNNKKKQ